MELNVFSPLTSNEESVFEELKNWINHDVLNRLFDILNRWLEQQWYEYLLKDPKIGPILSLWLFTDIELFERILTKDILLFIWLYVENESKSLLKIKSLLIENELISRNDIITSTHDTLHIWFYRKKIQIVFKIKK